MITATYDSQVIYSTKTIETILQPEHKITVRLCKERYTVRLDHYSDIMWDRLHSDTGSLQCHCVRSITCVSVQCGKYYPSLE